MSIKESVKSTSLNEEPENQPLLSDSEKSENHENDRSSLTKVMDKNEIRLFKKINKKNWNKIKLKKPVNIHSLFPSKIRWILTVEFYTGWYFILLLLGLLIIIACCFIHLYMINYWRDLLYGNILEQMVNDDVDIGNIVLFCATIVPYNNNLTNSFLNIPYASLPITNNYFFKPGPLLTFMDCYKSYWNKIDDKHKSFNGGRIKFFTNYNTPYEFCSQKNDNATILVNNKSCLTLNIKLPNKKSENLKNVLIYVSGQSFQHQYPYLASDEFVLDNNLIFISINYRLGIFGFPTLDLLKSPRNLAYFDFSFALKFIYNNLNKIGGNTNQITLLAEESGATLALTYLFAKQANIFFNKLWLIDSSTFLTKGLSRGLFYQFYNSDKILCSKFNSDDLIFNCLQKFSVEKLLQEVSSKWLNIDDYFYYLPNLLETRDSLLKLTEKGILFNPLKTVQKVGSYVKDVPIVIVSSLDYMPKQLHSNFENYIGNLAKHELLTRLRLDLLTYQTASSLVVLHKEITEAYSKYISEIENQSIFNQNLNEEFNPLGFQNVLKAIITDIRSLCPLSSLAKFLQVNSHIVNGPIYRILDNNKHKLNQSKIRSTGKPCDLNLIFQNNKENDGNICQTPNNADIYQNTLRQSLKEFIKSGKISSIPQMQYPMNSRMKDLEETFAFIGRLGWRSPNQREISALQLCNLWKQGTNEFIMLRTAAKVN